MDLEPKAIEDKHSHDEAGVEYTCPMHPEVVQAEPGSCPECGMDLEKTESKSPKHDHGTMSSEMNHDEEDFMSMIDVTKDLPRSPDGLAMDWIDVPFGPFFTGLPSGLSIMFMLDGDTVASSKVDSLVGNERLLTQSSMSLSDFYNRMTSLDPFSPNSYKLLACMAIENAANTKIKTETAMARIIIIEQERIASHLGWLALFAEQNGFNWLLQSAASLQYRFIFTEIKQNNIRDLNKAIFKMIKRLHITPLLKARTLNIGKVHVNEDILSGPVARASGLNKDSRTKNKFYTELGFIPACKKEGDAYARLQVRLSEISQSLMLIEKAMSISSVKYTTDNFSDLNTNTLNGNGKATIETPRGLATLTLALENGKVSSANLETPSTQHLTLIEQVTRQQELGDALVAIGSLDLSPWEIRQ